MFKLHLRSKLLNSVLHPIQLFNEINGNKVILNRFHVAVCAVGTIFEK